MEPRRRPGRVEARDVFETDKERDLADYLAAQGNYVRAVPRDSAPIPDPTPDSQVRKKRRQRGTDVELEHPRGPNLVSRAAQHIRRAAQRRPGSGASQARNVIVDLRGVADATEETARAIHAEIRESPEAIEGRLDYVRVISDTSDITFGPY
jgi:hypothetical protein